MGQVLSKLDTRADAEDEEIRAVLLSGGVDGLREASIRFVLPTGTEVGQTLSLLARCLDARAILEVGGSVGYSTIWLASAAQATGGLVQSIERDEGKVEEQRGNLEEAGLLEYVELLPGASDVVLPTLSGPYDLVLIDHWKAHYARDFDLIWPKVRRGGVVVADNILNPPMNQKEAKAYTAHVRSLPDVWSFTLPIGDGVEITVRL